MGGAKKFRPFYFYKVVSMLLRKERAAYSACQ